MISSLVIAEKEIRSSLVTPLAYAVMAAFLVFSGFFFFSLLGEFNLSLSQAAMTQDINPSLNEIVVSQFYQLLEIVLIFLVPILTMRSFAEEKRQGTFEILVTAPVSVATLVFGKFIGSLAIVALMLLLCFCFPLVLLLFADPEVLPVFVGFLGLLLTAAAYVAIGLAVSACSHSQTVAGVLSSIALLVLFVIDAPAEKIGGSVGAVLNYLATGEHSSNLLKGVVTGADVLYFVSLCLFGLSFATRAIEAERWR